MLPRTRQQHNPRDHRARVGEREHAEDERARREEEPPVHDGVWAAARRRHVHTVVLARADGGGGGSGSLEPHRGQRCVPGGAAEQCPEALASERDVEGGARRRRRCRARAHDQARAVCRAANAHRLGLLGGERARDVDCGEPGCTEAPGRHRGVHGGVQKHGVRAERAVRRLQQREHEHVADQVAVGAEHRAPRERVKGRVAAQREGVGGALVHGGEHKDGAPRAGGARVQPRAVRGKRARAEHRGERELAREPAARQQRLRLREVHGHAALGPSARAVGGGSVYVHGRALV